MALNAENSIIDTIFNFIYVEGGDVSSVAGWHNLTARLGIEPDDVRIISPEIKQRLKDNTDAAVAAGVFGVPTFVMEGEVFWGQDAMDMFLDWLDNPESFSTGEFARIKELPIGAQRRQSKLETDLKKP